MSIELTSALCSTIVTNTFIAWVIAVAVIIMGFVIWAVFNNEKALALKDKKINLNGNRFSDTLKFCSELVRLNAPFIALFIALMVAVIRIIWSILFVFIALWIGIVWFV